MFDHNCRKPNFSGSFYSSEKFQLEKLIEKYISDADVPEDIMKSNIVGITSPPCWIQVLWSCCGVFLQIYYEQKI